MDILEETRLCHACKCTKLNKFFKVKKNGEFNKTCIICNNRYNKNKIVVESTFKPVNLTQKCIKCKKERNINNFRIKKYVNETNKTCNSCILGVVM